MKIEILYSEICNIAGDLMNVRYLRHCLPQAEFIYTGLNETPAFVQQEVSMIYLGPMSERTQEDVIARLTPHRDRLWALIEAGTVCVFTGNAFEVLIDRIENEDGTFIAPLGLFHYTAKRKMFDRHNSLFLGTFEPANTEIVGYKHQFTQLYGDNTQQYLFRTTRGIGLNPESQLEGIRYRNLFATVLLGGVLVLNPDFLKYVLRLLGTDGTLAFEPEVYAMYQARLKEFKKPDCHF